MEPVKARHKFGVFHFFAAFLRLFLNTSGVRRSRWSIYISPSGRYNLQKDPLLSLALRNLTFEEEALHFTKSTLKDNKKKQSRIVVPLPHNAGELQAFPPSSERGELKRSTPARRSNP
jgi:hypothetical protein